MALVAINKDTCTKCGLCATQCNLIIFKEGSYPRQLPGTDEYCLRCGHCVAVCPAGSLTHRELPETTPIEKAQEISFKQCAQLIKGRRSVRNFRDKDVAGEDIERIIDTARYAPTGHNNQEVQWLVINDRAKMRQLSAIGADWLRFMIKNNPGMAAMFQGILTALDAGQDVFLRDAPALVTAYAEKNNPMAATDCAIVLGYFDLAANSLKLGCCWAGFFYMAAASFPAMVEAIGLPEGFTPYGALMLGYPKYKYARIPERRPARIIYRP
ncbi:MAG: nitroreductase family protein [Dehalococcoidales bacterium]|jgi:nitroreductase/NAD-dependent dihydropyrimidine dehydrogenase PreA subunit